MPIKIGDALLKLGVDKGDFDRQMGNIGDTIKKHQKAIGLGMIAMGGTIVAGLTMAVKAAAQEEAGIERLRVAMKNMGLSYDASRASLEKWIDTQQQKTAIADDQQRDSLAQLIRLTGNLTEAQNLLTLAMDIAVGTNSELATATTWVQYAMGGNWGMVERMIPALKQAATEEEKWLLLRKMFAGQAEAYGKTTEGQFKLLMNNIGDLKEAIGSVLLPAVKEIVGFVNKFVQYIKNLHPELIKWGTLSVTTAAGLTVLGGGVLIVTEYISHLIHGLTLLSHVITSRIIPKITALVASMWTWVAAQIAAIAATGYGIPIAIAAAVAIGTLTTGIIMLANQQSTQAETTNVVNEALQEYTKNLQENIPITGEAADITRQYKEQLDGVANAVHQVALGSKIVTENEQLLADIHLKLMENLRGLNVEETKRKTLLDLQTEAMLKLHGIDENFLTLLQEKIKAEKEVILTTEQQNAIAQKYVQSLLQKVNLTQEETGYLKEYADWLMRVTAAQRESNQAIIEGNAVMQAFIATQNYGLKTMSAMATLAYRLGGAMALSNVAREFATDAETLFRQLESQFSAYETRQRGLGIDWRQWMSFEEWLTSVGRSEFIGYRPYGLQHGGIITKPTLALLGEGNKREAVIPLEGQGQPVIEAHIYLGDHEITDIIERNIITKVKLQGGL